MLLLIAKESMWKTFINISFEEILLMIHINFDTMIIRGINNAMSRGQFKRNDAFYLGRDESTQIRYFKNTNAENFDKIFSLHNFN